MLKQVQHDNEEKDMIIEPILFYASLATIFILSVTLIMFVFYLGKILKREHSPPDTASKVIDEANNKAIDIVNKANLSTDILSENFREEIKRISSLQTKEFEKTTSDFMKLYAQILQDLKSKNIEVFQNVSKDIEVNTTAEIKSFKESMENLTVSSEKLVKKKIDSDYLDLKKEIQNYKDQEMKKIDQDIYKILEKISKLVLGKAISLSEHEDLVQKSLEKAKKEGMFE